ncbi:hypothetical protein [Microbacterium sp. B35-30]|uniref:hypothetical protein n=1 Tax=Microbacterium sp. B35-30 TaxID=1962642 RepID=UPI001952CCCF|nr:hypothetical protein [Microbacterium sp. B35-30]
MPRPAASPGAQLAAALRTARVTARTRRIAAGAMVAAGLVLSGCAGPPAVSPDPASTLPPAVSPDPASTLPEGVTVELAQLRADVAPRQAQVRVANGSDIALKVRGVRVDDPRFEGSATRVIPDRASTIPPGGLVDIRVQLPPVDCTAPDDGEAEVVLEIVGESSSAEVTVPAPDALGFLAPLHARECLQERMSDAATLAFTGFQPSAPGEPAALELTVTPAGAGEATVVGLERTNLLEFAGSSAQGELYPLDLHVAATDTEPVVVQIPLLPFRCDPHAVLEDKRGTIFDVRVEHEGESGEFTLFVGDDLRGRILTWVGDWCGFGS